MNKNEVNISTFAQTKRNPNNQMNEKAFEFNLVDFILLFESDYDLTDEEIIEGFQHMINSGIVWELQGFYGRTAQNLIDNGYCFLPKET